MHSRLGGGGSVITWGAAGRPQTGWIHRGSLHKAAPEMAAGCAHRVGAGPKTEACKLDLRRDDSFAVSPAHAHRDHWEPSERPPSGVVGEAWYSWGSLLSILYTGWKFLACLLKLCELNPGNRRSHSWGRRSAS